VSETDVTALVTEAARLHDLARSLRERAEQARGAAQDTSARDRAAGEELGRLGEALDADAAALEELSATLAARITTLSSVQASVVVEPLHRLVRDQSSSSGKRISLQVTGDDMLLGRRAAGALRGALVHLVRNAIDHGIEPAALRRERGKNPDGRLAIAFERADGMVRVAVEDDGAGLDAERIRDAAVRMGVVPAEQRDTLREEELLALVFRPGFTTRRNVTATSGRGVGLDAVAALVREVGGDVTVESWPTKGTRFVVTLPSS
jgi:chemotaxis protein histidine kinase CheA